MKPTKSSKAIRVLHAGDKLEVIAEGKTWFQVKDPETGKKRLRCQGLHGKELIKTQIKKEGMNMNITMNNNHEINEQELHAVNGGGPIFIFEPIDPEPGSFLDRFRKWFHDLVTDK